MKKWFKDRHFRSLLKNTSYLGLSQVVAAVSGLVTVSLAGRSLGVALFGTLILIHSYAQAAGGLTKFQSWQLVIRYGGGALAAGRDDDFVTATRFALGLDILSGLVGMALAMALLPWLGPWFGIKPDQMWLALLYCFLIPTMTAATPHGVLRAVDRFDLTSVQETVTPIARMILVILAFLLHWPFAAFVLVWFVTDLAGDLLAWFFAGRELKRRGLLRRLAPTLRPRGLDGAWRFAIHVNLTSSLDSAWGSIARLVVGGLLGPAEAGLFRVASTLTETARKPATLLARAYYPEIMRMDMTSKSPWNLMLRSVAIASLVSGLFVLAVALFGKALLAALFGADFVPAYRVLMVLLAVPLLTIVAFPLPSTLYALDRPDAPLKARLAGTIAYFGSIVPSTHLFGLVGAGLSFVLAHLVMVGWLALVLGREYGRVKRARAATA